MNIKEKHGMKETTNSKINIFNCKKRNFGISLFAILLCIELIYTIVASYISNLIDPQYIDSNPIVNESLEVIFILSVIIAPIVETFIFQFLIIEILLLFKVKHFAIIVISGLLFAVAHFYNLAYILAIVFPGLLFAWYYLYLKVHKKNAFLSVTLLHACSNLFAFIFDDLLGWF